MLVTRNKNCNKLCTIIISKNMEIFIRNKYHRHIFKVKVLINQLLIIKINKSYIDLFYIIFINKISY
jgi:hypothetical protein